MKQALLKYLNHPKHLLVSFSLISIVHLVFKSLYLDHAGFWYDETFGLWYSQQDWGLIKHTSEWDLNPPLYYYFLWIWRNLFGISEFSIRFSSVLFSSLSAGLIYVFSAKYFNKLTGIISVLIFTASSNILFFAHEARCYSMVIFLSLCSSLLFFSLLQKRNYKTAISLGIVNFLLIYLHYFTGLILFFQFITIIILRDKEFTKHLVIGYLITLSLVVWRFTKKMILLIAHHEKNWWTKKATFYDLKMALFDFFNGPMILLLFSVLIALAISLLIYNRKEIRLDKTEKVKFLYILFCGAGAFFITFLAGTITPIFLMRYVLYTSCFLYITIGYLTSLLHGSLKMGGIVLIIGICTYSIFQLDLKTEKTMDFRGAMKTIKQLEGPETVILVETRDVGPLFAYYYDQTIFSDYYHMAELMNNKNIYFVSSLADVEKIDLKRFNKVILTQTFENLNPGKNKLISFLESQYIRKTNANYYSEVNIAAFGK